MPKLSEIDPEKIVAKLNKLLGIITEETEEKPMVGRINCKIPMTLDHFHDFYFLQALQVNVNMKVAANPDLQFKRSVEKLKEDVELATEEIIPNIALRTFVYLYAACLGEARHARTPGAKRRWVPVTLRRARSELYAMIADFAPSKQNIDALVDIFDQEWTAGYGGEAWKNIAEALHLYRTATPAAFIDYVIDLEHNGGTVFNKTDAKYAIKFRTEYASGRFKHFLDYKFKYNILEKNYSNEWGGSLMITKPVAKLLERYAVIFETKPITWAKPLLASLDEYQVEWGNEIIAVEDKWLEGADVRKGNVPNARKLMIKVGMYDIYPGSYTLPQLKHELARKKQKAIKFADKFADKKLEKDINKVVNKWLKWAKTTVKVPKAKKTFALLPCKVAWVASGIKLAIPVKYGKIGKTTPYGFELVTESHMGIHPAAIDSTSKNYVDDGALYEDGHLSLNYGQVLLHIKSGNWKVSEKKLEALLD